MSNNWLKTPVKGKVISQGGQGRIYYQKNAENRIQVVASGWNIVVRLGKRLSGRRFRDQRLFVLFPLSPVAVDDAVPLWLAVDFGLWALCSVLSVWTGCWSCVYNSAL